MSSSLVWRGETTIAVTDSVSNLGVKLGAEYLLGKANETVPHLDGILEQSGTVDAGHLEAVISYGGAASDYAVVQHERVEFNHPGKGRAKWLELTIQEQQKQTLDIVAGAIRRGLGG